MTDRAAGEQQLKLLLEAIHDLPDPCARNAYSSFIVWLFRDSGGPLENLPCVPRHRS